MPRLVVLLSLALVAMARAEEAAPAAPASAEPAKTDSSAPEPAAKAEASSEPAEAAPPASAEPAPTSAPASPAAAETPAVPAESAAPVASPAAVPAVASPSVSSPAEPAVASSPAAEPPLGDALFDALGVAPAPVEEAPVVAAPAPASAPDGTSPATPAPPPDDEPLVLDPAKDRLAAEPIIVDEDPIELSPAPPRAPAAVAQPDTDLALEVGWNSPAAQGVRLLRHVDGTDVAFGLGVGILTFWGPKVSVLVRHASDFTQGFYVQGSLALSGEGEFEQEVNGRLARFERTAGRTVDGIVGWRFRTTAGYIEFSTGWSFNIRGVALQKADKPENLVRLDDLTRSQVQVRQPGGFISSASYGWLF